MRPEFLYRRAVISARLAVALLSPLLLADNAQAGNTLVYCVKQNTSCLQKCDSYPNGQLYRSCLQRCGSQLDRCMIALDHPDGKVDTGGKPPKPPRPTDNSVPTGGGKKDEKTPRADNGPLGGGVFKSSPPSSGNSGPILRSNNSMPMQSGGRNGGEFRRGTRD